jgi:dCTP diphosphatase
MPPQSDASTTVAELQALVRDFTDRRDWAQFHHPKDLGVALAAEVGELLEHFRFLTNEQIRERLSDESARRELAHEAADCLWLLLRLAEVVGFDLSSSLREKLALAERKYPAARARGAPHKYTAYESEGE